MEHPGFSAVQHKIAAKEGISEDRAAAILASSSRHASEHAKEHNPHLRRVEVHVHQHAHYHAHRHEHHHHG